MNSPRKESYLVRAKREGWKRWCGVAAGRRTWWHGGVGSIDFAAKKTGKRNGPAGTLGLV